VDEDVSIAPDRVARHRPGLFSPSHAVREQDVIKMSSIPAKPAHPAAALTPS